MSLMNATPDVEIYRTRSGWHIRQVGTAIRLGSFPNEADAEAFAVPFAVELGVEILRSVDHV